MAKKKKSDIAKKRAKTREKKKRKRNLKLVKPRANSSPQIV